MTLNDFAADPQFQPGTLVAFRGEEWLKNPGPCGSNNVRFLWHPWTSLVRVRLYLMTAQSVQSVLNGLTFKWKEHLALLQILEDSGDNALL
jgi:hypothetical protein